MTARRTPRRIGSALLALALPLGCGSQAPPPKTTDDPEPTASVASEPAAASAPTSAPASAPATASATASASAPAAAEANPKNTKSAAPSEPPPAPLTDAERKELETTCKPLQKAMLKAKTKDPEAALEEALKKPPAMKAADLERCKGLFSRQISQYLAAAIEVEATVTLSRLVKGMVSAYQAKRALCPSTEQPVPSDLARLRTEPYTSTAADWDRASWKCMGFSMEGQGQRFQYEVRVDPNGKMFRAIARGFVFRGAAAVEIVQEASITEKGIEVKPPARSPMK